MIERIKPIISVEQLKSELPVPHELAVRREKAVNTVKDIIGGRDKRKLVIVGPCSCDNTSAVLEYAQKLKSVADKISDNVYVLIRVHTSKPRTFGGGYTGMIHYPNAENGITDINGGLYALRKTHIEVAQTGLFASDEMLYPSAVGYIDDIVSYVTLGARSAFDSVHRFTAGGLDIPVGVKNTTSGDITELIGCIHAVQTQTEFMSNGYQVRSSGNEYAHAILRGAVDINGNNITNYDGEYVRKLIDGYSRHGIGNPAVIIDTGHGNSGKNPDKVPHIVSEVLRLAHDDSYNDVFKGFMIESYLYGGSRESGGKLGQSITDPCLGFAETERLLYAIAEDVR